MTNVTLETFTHNSQSCIAIKFPYNFEIKEYIKKFDGVRWTKTHSTFYIYYNEVRLEDFKNYLVKGNLNIIKLHATKNIPRFSKGVKIEHKPLNKEKTIVYRHYLAFLEGKRFSKSTIASYSGSILEFLRFTDQKPIDKLDENDVRNYILKLIQENNYARQKIRVKSCSYSGQFEGWRR